MRFRQLRLITRLGRRIGVPRFSSTGNGPLDPLVQTLLQNPELSPEEATNEARWIRQEARASVQRQGAMMLGLAIPSQADVEALIGLESGVITGLVERRAKGEPLQYVLGEILSER
jgi:release factor glutamine methyltransferase